VAGEVARMERVVCLGVWGHDDRVVEFDEKGSDGGREKAIECLWDRG
jgi:hypothetical protein